MAGTWFTTSPDGTKSTKRNVSILQNNTTYMTTNLALDHYWNNDADKDGYHKQVSMDDQAADPTSLPNGIDSMFYVRKKTATESPDIQLSEPFNYVTPDSGTTNHYLQLGFRAMVCFNVNGSSNPGQADVLYYHNLNLQSASPPGVEYISLSGSFYSFKLNFLNNMPSANYIPSVTLSVGGGTASTYAAIIIDGSKTDSECSFLVRSGISGVSPVQICVSICGG